MNKVNGIILALGLMAALCGTASATQLYVNENGWWRDGGTFNTSSTPIQSAVNAADDGDSIFVYNGTYYEGGGMSITKDRITLQGEDANTTTIHGKWTAEKVVYVSGNYVNVSGFTVAGSAESGSGIYVNADYCTISDNDAPEMGYGIYLSSSSNCVLTNNTASLNTDGYGIYLDYSTNCVLTNNTANSNEWGYGICLGSSSNCTLENNIASSNRYGTGICLGSSSNCTLENNIASSNRYGIRLYSSSNCTLENNTANSNTECYGIWLSSSSNNTITGNNVSNNDDGIRLTSTSINNNIKGNTVSYNTNYGMYLDWSGDNEIYHNNFIGNDEQAYDHHGFNEWDKGSIIGGNYWSDHACHGNPSNGTEPYTGIDTDAGSVDNYPFEEPDGWVTKNQPPIANFTYIPLNPIINQTVTFNASNSADLDGTIINYKWDFGDGNTTNTTEEIITYFYTSAEDYTVNLTVTDDGGATNSTSNVITVYPPTIIYVPDDYAKIQWAVDNASVGDTIFVWNGSYYENVDVNKPRLTLEGEGAEVVTVTAADAGDPVFEVTADYVNISGFAVRGATDSEMAGVYLGNADYCNISGNNVYGNSNGIYLWSSSDNTLTNNTANSNNLFGIYLWDSSDNTLTNNTANSNNWDGIRLWSSSDNTLTNNTANSNGNGNGIYLYDSSSNTLANNTASNNRYGSGIYLHYSSSNTLYGNTASDNEDGGGIYMDHSSSNTLNSNIANSNNNYGICLHYSSSNTLYGNTASDHEDGGGIRLWQSSSSNTLQSNNCSNNDYGIFLGNADHNIITCNWVHHNTWCGFWLCSGSTGNNISYNNIIENGDYNAASGGWEWQFHIDQYNPVEAKHNYWGAGMNSSTIDASIHDDEEGGWGEVEFYPFEIEPVPCAPGPKRPAFTTTDAVIALQIAVGSRPPDLRWDVSGDGSVTSLDALMILQAAAGGIGIG